MSIPYTVKEIIEGLKRFEAIGIKDNETYEKLAYILDVSQLNMFLLKMTRHFKI